MMKSLIALIFIFNINAVDFRDAYKGKINLSVKDMPTEYKILIESINHYPLSKEDKDDLLSNIVMSDAFFTKIPKNDLFLLTKMEIYKAVLSYHNSENIKSIRVNQPIINELMKKANTAKDELNPFASWILRAVIKDLQSIIKYKYYQTYLTQKAQSKKLKNIELLKLDKKITLLSPWISLFNLSTSEEINLALRPLHFRIIRRLAFLSKTIYQTSSFDKMPPMKELNQLSLFKYSRELTNRESTLQKIDDVIGNIEIFPSKGSSTNISDLPNPSNDWIPKDDMQSLKIKKGDLFPEPDPNYKKPESLPEPVNDWLLDI
ncbi:hypothetical protein [Halobacteriovorax marinus]|nr:hypothetical protein [Halobacteriovorax marinus]